MSAMPNNVRREARAESTRREILDAAWGLVREHGLAALTMRELGARVGMRAQSLYVYFPSKHAIYDAMFAEGYRELLDRWKRAIANGPQDPEAVLRRRNAAFLRFCVEDPVRHQLMFQRTIPGFEPSPESYAPSLAAVDDLRARLRACGVDDPRAWDAWTAVAAGLVAQQIANEPGGNRWLGLADELTDLLLEHYGTGKPDRREERP